MTVPPGPTPTPAPGSPGADAALASVPRRARTLASLVVGLALIAVACSLLGVADQLTQPGGTVAVTVTDPSLVALVPRLLSSGVTGASFEHLDLRLAETPLGSTILDVPLAPLVGAALLFLVAQVVRYGSGLVDEVEGLV